MTGTAQLHLTCRSGGHILILNWPNSDEGAMGVSEAICSWFRAELLDWQGCLHFAKEAKDLMLQADKQAKIDKFVTGFMDDFVYGP